jgi:hypothetical protein
MIGIDAKSDLKFRHPLGEFIFIRAQISKHDMRVGVVGIERHGVPSACASQRTMLFHSFATVCPSEMVAIREPGMCLGKPRIEFYRLLKKLAGRSGVVKRQRDQRPPANE